MISTLIKTLTASNDASLSFEDGSSDVVFDNTYDEYMFVCTDINPATDGAHFTFQVNGINETGYDEKCTTTFFNAYVNESDSDAALAYTPGHDQPQGTAFQSLHINAGNGTHKSGNGILNIFSPANATFVTHYLSRFNVYRNDNYTVDHFSAGYFNTASSISDADGPIAIDEIQFKFTSGNFDGVIQMYGIS